MHLSIIKRVYQDSRRLRGVDLPSYFAVVFLDIQHATISCQRTVLDVAEGSRTEKCFKRFWGQAEASLPSLRGDAPNGIDPSLKFCRLVSCFSQLREMYLTVEHLLRVTPQPGPGIWNKPGSEASNWFYVMSRTAILMSRLNNKIVDNFELLPSDHCQLRLPPAQARKGKGKANFCARLVAMITALFYTHRMSNIGFAPESICASSRLRKAGRGPIPQLCRTLQFMQRYSSIAETSTFAKLRL